MKVEGVWVPITKPAVAHLFSPGCPFAVALGVTSFIVDPFEGEVREWLWSNVSEELSEVVEPLRAKGNPAAAVVLPCFVLWVGASTLRVSPSPILGSIRMPFDPPAIPAGFGFVVADVASLNHLLKPAVTTAEPETLKPLVTSLGNDGEFVELHARNGL